MGFVADRFPTQILSPSPRWYVYPLICTPYCTTPNKPTTGPHLYIARHNTKQTYNRASFVHCTAQHQTNLQQGLTCTLHGTTPNKPTTGPHLYIHCTTPNKPTTGPHLYIALHKTKQTYNRASLIHCTAQHQTNLQQSLTCTNK